MTNTNKKSFNLFFALFLYKSVIEVIYINFISPLYLYSGLNTDPDLSRYILSTIYLIIFYIIKPKNKIFASTSIFNLIGIFLLIPTLSYYWLNSQSHLYTVVLILCFLLISIVLRLHRIDIIDGSKYMRNALQIIFFLYLLVTVLIIVMEGGIDPRAFDFTSIYSLREEIEISTGIGYLLNWCAKVLTPFFFAYFYFKKRYGLSLLVVVIQLFLYLTFGFKAFLFSIILMIICIMIDKGRNFDVNFTYFYLSIQIVSAWSYVQTNSITLINSITYRMVFVPAQVQYQYYDFFSINPKVNFADGIIGSVFSLTSPYNMPMPNVISMAYYGKIFSQNTGVFGDAYGNGGFIAMILIALLLGCLLILLDMVTTNIPNIIVLSSFSYMVFVFNDTSLLTSLLTGGLGLLILLFYIFNSELESQKLNIDNIEKVKINTNN